ncbi:MAG: hypothetical protein RLZZ276_3521 [Pseudomonadota bacterium]|jgi:hypothetical protein
MAAKKSVNAIFLLVAPHNPSFSELLQKLPRHCVLLTC